jgi:hypothetical protein
MEPIILLSVKKTILVLTIVVVLLGSAGFIVQYSSLTASPGEFNVEKVHGVAQMFNLSGEANVPAWYKSSTLLICSLLLFIIAAARRRDESSYWSYWRDLGTVFLLLSVDELTLMHRSLGRSLSLVLQTSGFLYYAWVIVGIVFVALLAPFYIGFLRSLPVMPMFLFLFSGTVYVASALGMKMIEGWYVDQYGQATLVFIALTVLRQMLEMLSVIVFIYSLLTYMRHNLVDSLIRIVD